MAKYKIVQFDDGKYAVQKSTFFGLFKDYLSSSIKGICWDDPVRVDFYCKVHTLEQAKDVLKLHTDKPELPCNKVVREIDV